MPYCVKLRYSSHTHPHIYIYVNTAVCVCVFTGTYLGIRIGKGIGNKQANLEINLSKMTCLWPACGSGVELRGREM